MYEKEIVEYESILQEYQQKVALLLVLAIISLLVVGEAE